MSTKKTRKRAYIPPSHEVVNRRERDTSTRTTKSTQSRPAGRGSRNYVPPKPSYKRTAKRLPIYFLMILALQYYLLSSDKGDRSSLDILLLAAGQSAIVTVVFAPFMHVMDKLAYNRYMKKAGIPTESA